MATNRYISANRTAGKYGEQVGDGGPNKVVAVPFTFEKTADDTDGSILRIATLKSNMVFLSATIMCDALSGCTDVDLGLYRTVRDGGAVADKDCFMDGQTLASASKVLNGGGALEIADLGKRLYEHAAFTVTTDPVDLDLALTFNTGGTATGTISGIVYFAE